MGLLSGLPLLGGLDIGGTLCKIAVFIPDEAYQQVTRPLPRKVQVALESSAWVENDLTLKVRGGRLMFLKYLTSETEKARTAMASLGIVKPGSVLFATGGGAYKFEKEFAQLGAKLVQMDEMECIVRGLWFFNKMEGEFFTIRNTHFQGTVGSDRAIIQPDEFHLRTEDGLVVVNIGSGVSFLHCTDKTYRRIGGSSLGGSTFLGLVALLTGVDSFDEAIDLASLGDSSKVDMLVRDIYGGDEEAGKNLGLRPTWLASSFGKAIDKRVRQAARREDLALSCLVMISMNLAVIAHLHANSLGAKHVVFTGNFLARSGKDIKQRRKAKFGKSSELHLHRRNDIAMKTLSYAVRFWSEDRKAIFFKHEGYLGSVGALSKGSGSQISWALEASDSSRL